MDSTEERTKKKVSENLLKIPRKYTNPELKISSFEGSFLFESSFRQGC